MKNYYKILQIDPAAEEEVIRGAYQRLSQKYHPDRPGGDQEKMTEINEAKDILLDASKRMEYDQKLSHANSQTFVEGDIADEEKEYGSDINELAENKNKFNIKAIGLGLLVIFSGVAFWFYSLGWSFFYNLFQKVSYYSGWATVILFLLFSAYESMTEPKKDGRYSTGYKKNALPSKAPWHLLSLSIVIWLISKLATMYLIPESVKQDIATQSVQLNGQLSVSTENGNNVSQQVKNATMYEAVSDKRVGRVDFGGTGFQEPEKLSTKVSNPTPSFDCANAEGAVELMICSSKELAELDIQLAEIYKQKYKAVPLDFMKKQVEHGQADWLTNVRNVCQDEACLLDVYKQRIEYFMKPETPAANEPCAIPGHC